MKIIVENKRKSIERLSSRYILSEIIDVTSKGKLPWLKFSPFYPHKEIPVPFSNIFSETVEGIWQGLKVFEKADIDTSKFKINDMKNIKRTTQRYGKVLGHRMGTSSDILLSYMDARYQIYLPSYKWVLEKFLSKEIELLKTILMAKDVVLLDYETNCDIDNLSKPLSHAYLVKLFIENNWPA